MNFFSPYLYFVRGLKNKLDDINVSFQILMVLTVILTAIMYLVERSIQPEEFDSFLTTFAWAISKYTGDIAGYGDFTPVTIVGKAIATIVGLLGIAIFAIPAGLIGAGFVEALEEDKLEKENQKNSALIEDAFESYRPNLPYFSLKKTYPRFIDIKLLQTRLNISETHIFQALNYSERLRLREKKMDLNVNVYNAFAMEYFQKNCEYGIRHHHKKSNMLLINPVGYSEQGISHFTTCLARDVLKDRVSFLSNEYFAATAFLKEKIVDFRKLTPENTMPAYQTYLEDLKQITKKGDWVILFDVSKADRYNSMHINFGSTEKKPGYDGFTYTTIDDKDTLKQFSETLKTVMQETTGLNVGNHEEIAVMAENDICRYLHDTLQLNVIRIYLSVGILAGPDKVYFESIDALGQSLQKTILKC